MASPPTGQGGIPFGMLPGFLPGASSLLEQLDRRLLIVLRDGRHLVGVLRSFDQFSNCILEDTSERRFILRPPSRGGPVYTDINLGLYLVRGDSMVLLGEVDDGEVGVCNPSSKRNTVPSTHHDGIVMSKVTHEEFEMLCSKMSDEDRNRTKIEWNFDTDSF